MSTVLITGANRGIGLALAKAYAADGDTVIATCRAPDQADHLRATGAEIHALEATDGASVARLADALGGRAIDLLIHNAGVGERAGLGALDYDTFSNVLEVNTIGPVRVIEALAGAVERGEGKTIAVLSSQLGSIATTTADWGLIYRVSKAGLNMALKAASYPLAERGITVLTLHPGWVRTDMGGEQAPVTPDESAAGLKRVIADAGPSKDLRFLDFKGETLPW